MSVQEIATHRTVAVGETVVSNATGRSATLVGAHVEGTHSYVSVLRDGETVARRAYAHVYGLRVIESPTRTEAPTEYHHEGYLITIIRNPDNATLTPEELTRISDLADCGWFDGTQADTTRHAGVSWEV